MKMLHRFVELSYLLISDTHSFQPKDVWREEKKENNKTHTHRFHPDSSNRLNSKWNQRSPHTKHDKQLSRHVTKI